MSIDVHVTDTWRRVFPGARVGLLVLDDVRNPASDAALDQHVRDVENRLRQRFAHADRATLNTLPAIEAYQRHYRNFGQTYHVLRQLESVALKGRSVSSRGVLVAAMFASEIETLLLTAGHDFDNVIAPLAIDCSTEGDHFVGIGGQEHVVRANDMLMRDAAGIISAVVYGPDQRTRLTADTRRALFSTYVPAGIGDDAVRLHLAHIADNVRLAVPEARTALIELYP